MEKKLPDIDARKRLAVLAGLKKLPELDQMAIFRLDALMKDQLRQKHKRFDSVEQVRTVRGD